MRIGLGSIVPRLQLGLGQPTCPSLEQAQGISDCSDPCQATGPACANYVTPDQLNNIKNFFYQAGLAAGDTATCPTGSTCTILPGIPDTVVYLGGGFIVLVMFMSAIPSGGRRR